MGPRWLISQRAKQIKTTACFWAIQIQRNNCQQQKTKDITVELIYSRTILLLGNMKQKRQIKSMSRRKVSETIHLSTNLTQVQPYPMSLASQRRVSQRKSRFACLFPTCKYVYKIVMTSSKPSTTPHNSTSSLTPEKSLTNHAKSH